MRKVMDRDVIRTVMDITFTTQTEIAENMGYENQSAVSQLSNRKRASLDKVVAALEKMGCTVVVRKKGADLFEIITDWKVDKHGE